MSESQVEDQVVESDDKKVSYKAGEAISYLIYVAFVALMCYLFYIMGA